jgi:hypothetical protein
MKFHSTDGVPVQPPPPDSGMKQNGASVRLAVPNHGAVDLKKIDDKKDL